MPQPYRIAIVNRGEPAMRFINMVEENRLFHGRELSTLALYTEPDRNALFVRSADHAVGIGGGLVGSAVAAYLDHGRVLRAIEQANADAVWVGWGFVAEDPDFAQACIDRGLAYLGPRPETMRKLADKIEAKRVAEGAGVPVVPWSDGPVHDVDAAVEHANRIGYPVVVKAAAGGGGRGIRIAESPEMLGPAFEEARTEGQRYFGNPLVFLERMVRGGRHLESQVLGDSHGTVWVVGVRECSVQRRRQKVLEESGPASPDSALEQRLAAHAQALARAVNYQSAGTVEFLHDPATGDVYFMEVNTRLQVEHTVTEMTTGIDLVRYQLEIALGGQLPPSPPASTGHAIEVRLNAEEPRQAFAPSPGRLALLRWPTGPGVRIDSGVVEGDTIASDFDSMIAKVIAWGPDRGAALSRLDRALRQCDVVVEGGATNRSFLLRLLAHPDIRGGPVGTTWLDEIVQDGSILANPHSEVAVIRAAVEVYEEEMAARCDHFLSTAFRGRPEIAADNEVRVQLRYGPDRFAFVVQETARCEYRVVAEDGSEIQANVRLLGPHESTVDISSRHHRALLARSGPDFRIEVDGSAHLVQRDEGGVVRAPVGGVVVSLHVSEGDEVAAGDPLAVLESMKMETAVTAPFAGHVRAVEARRNSQVDPGQLLVRLEPSDSETAAAMTQESVDLELLASPPRSQGLRHLKDAMLGFDVAAEWLTDRRDAAMGGNEPDADAPTRFTEEAEVLSIFTDVQALAPQSPGTSSGDAGTPADELLTYLRSPGHVPEALGEEFLRRLDTALGHHGTNQRDDTGSRDRALMRLYGTRNRTGVFESAIVAILARWRRDARHLASHVTPDVDDLLARLVDLTAGSLPTLSEMARWVRLRFQYEPALEERRGLRAEARRRCLASLSDLAVDIDPAEIADDLIRNAEPWQTWFVGWLLDQQRGGWTRGLRVLADILYRHVPVHPVSDWHDEGSVPFVTVDLIREGASQRVMLVLIPDGSSTGFTGDHRWLEDVDEWPASVDVIDVVWGHEASAGRPASSVLEAVELLGSRTGAAVVNVLTRGAGSPYGTHTATFVREGATYSESDLYQDLHPAEAERLELWRLDGFDVEKLRSQGDFHMFAATARENPRDHRLFVLTSMREALDVPEPSRAENAVSALEGTLLRCLDLLRQARSRHAQGRTFTHNRVVTFVEADWNLPLASLRDIAERVAPATRGLALDQVVLRLRHVTGDTAERRDLVVHMSLPPGGGIQIGHKAPSTEPVRTLGRQRVMSINLQRRGLMYPYDIVRLLTSPGAAVSDFPPGRFLEYDIAPDGALRPTDRSWGENVAAVVVGVVTNVTAKHPEGMTRVAILNDPSMGMGALAEQECRRIIAAIDLAESLRVPIEWFAASSGAKVAMDSGTENMDWTARVLRRLIEHTQAGHEVNVIVTGINVGAQSYWNAEATMLMHTRGILVMAGDNAMVLTGKTALEYSGSVSARTNTDIGGFDRVMGPNGEGQFWVPDVEAACGLLFRYYELTYVVPGEAMPRRRPTSDPAERDAGESEHRLVGGGEFHRVADIFDMSLNPERKRPFDIRSVMRAVADADDQPLERWAHLRDGETAVVWDIHLGSSPVTMIGIESHELQRSTIAPADGPRRWTSGTLFPMSSKKVARAINAASGVRPVVVLANLSGFDGSPESMRRIQLEYGAEIGRAVVNFKGPIVFCVLSRYHGGAFVVFSKALNEHLHALAISGARASVLGGAPAAGVVFAREVEQLVQADPRVRELEEAMDMASELEAASIQGRLAEMRDVVRSEARGHVATEFDGVHTIARAKHVGSIDEVVEIRDLRRRLVALVDAAREEASG